MCKTSGVRKNMAYVGPVGWNVLEQYRIGKLVEKRKFRDIRR